MFRVQQLAFKHLGARHPHKGQSTRTAAASGVERKTSRMVLSLSLRMDMMLLCLAVRVASGTWVGDTWLPPNGRLFTVREIQEVHGDRDTLVIGDSLGRRLTSTLAYVLRDQSQGDVTSKAVDEAADGSYVRGHANTSYSVPRIHGNGTRVLDYQWAPCADDAAKVAQSLNMAERPKYSLVIVCIGIHDALGYCCATQRGSACHKGAFNDTQVTERMLVGAHGTLSALAGTPQSWESSPVVLWRTTPYADCSVSCFGFKGGMDSIVNTIAARLNTHVLTHHPPSVHVSDVAKHVNAKSQGREREAGDQAAHYNNIVRMVTIQCLTHKLAQVAEY